MPRLFSLILQILIILYQFLNNCIISIKSFFINRQPELLFFINRNILDITFVQKNNFITLAVIYIIKLGLIVE